MLSPKFCCALGVPIPCFHQSGLVDAICGANGVNYFPERLCKRHLCSSNQRIACPVGSHRNLSDKVVHGFLLHGAVRTRIYMKATATNRSIVLQAPYSHDSWLTILRRGSLATLWRLIVITPYSAWLVVDEPQVHLFVYSVVPYSMHPIVLVLVCCCWSSSH